MWDEDVLADKAQSEEPIVVIESPFETRDSVSDVTFLVEGKELHFCKSFLVASSPMFEKMFSSDFKEKESSFIPLPDKTLVEMDVFLQQLHPVHSWKPLKDDILETVLLLADEYQVEHVRLKSELYITTRLNNNATSDNTFVNRGIFCNDPPEISPTHLTIVQVLFYLRMCDEHQLKNPRQSLMQLASRTSVKALENLDAYKPLCDATKFELMEMRCLWLEDQVNIF